MRRGSEPLPEGGAFLCERAGLFSERSPADGYAGGMFVGGTGGLLADLTAISGGIAGGGSSLLAAPESAGLSLSWLGTAEVVASAGVIGAPWHATKVLDSFEREAPKRAGQRLSEAIGEGGETTPAGSIEPRSGVAARA